ncbi:MAG: NAD(P)(+) transhydrogenase (Re/Si-specific) subunit beta [Paludibacteraceae bacterium]|nr:NAD(P)(+) transhydrogenase (Re/Si-specific) subunit beta [Paludibacteraceae bacterium]
MTTVQIILSVLLSLAVLGGISMMSKVKTAVAGNMLSALAMLVGVVATVWFSGVMTVWTIYVAVIIGALIGSLMAQRAQMIQMPQLVALFNGLGGGASALVGVMTYMGWGKAVGPDGLTVVPEYPLFVNFTAMLAIAVGMITLVGSLVAAAKLARLIDGRPKVYAAHSLITMCLLLLSVVMIVLGTIYSGNLWIALASVLLTAAFGYMFAIRVGGADMPITISLLNSLSGVAGSIAGMAISDIFLVAVGGIVGASGLLLTQIMCRAMNRSLMSILLGGAVKKKTTAATATQPSSVATPTVATQRNGKTVFPENADFEQLLQQLNDMEVKQLLDAIEALTKEVAGLRAQLAGQAAPVAAQEKAEKTPASVLRDAKDVIIVPGYGMALAQAQHAVKQLADKLEYKGARVRFAIHPVAGRMPGHMNVLLAEADIPYEKLYEMQAINDDFKTVDAVVVIGANDVLNPAANTAEGTPIYGMPVLAVADAKEVIVCNYDLKPGYAGVENPLYTREKGVYLCLGDAKETLMKLTNEI